MKIFFELNSANVADIAVYGIRRLFIVQFTAAKFSIVIFASIYSFQMLPKLTTTARKSNDKTYELLCNVGEKKLIETELIRFQVKWTSDYLDMAGNVRIRCQIQKNFRDGKYMYVLVGFSNEENHTYSSRLIK